MLRCSNVCIIGANISRCRSWMVFILRILRISVEGLVLSMKLVSELTNCGDISIRLMA